MKPNNLLTCAALAAALLCGSTLAHAQKTKDKSRNEGEPIVVQVEPNVKVKVSRQPATPATPVPGLVTVVKVKPKISTKSDDDEDEAEKDAEKEREPRPFISQQTIAADQNVIISLSLLSGSITVHGSDRRDVRVQTNDEKRIELRRKDGTAGSNAPATRIQVLFYDPDEEGGQAEECGGSTDVKMDVPRGATVILKTQEGDIDVSDVGEARVSTSNGDISMRRVARSVEANTMSGDVSVRDASGHVRLNSISGSVEAINVSVLDAGDFVQAKSVSGDVTLEKIGPARVEAKTISGELNLEGALAPGGHYDLNTTSGDITLTMPENVSFKLTAQVFTTGEINTGFPIKQMGRSSSAPTPPTSGQLTGVYGTGDATINLNSFSGTIRLIKK